MNLNKAICLLLCLSIIAISTGCGSYWYPERKGQSGGKLDSKVVLMDALLCLCFVIPGVVAFYIDIDSGYIYLPPGYSEGKEKDNARIAEFSQKAKIQFLSKEGSKTISLRTLSGSNKLEKNSELLYSAKNSQEWRFYYENQIVECHKLPLNQSNTKEVTLASYLKTFQTKN